MDFQEFVDQIAVPCAVLSVERTPEGGCGAIRFHRVNEAFRRMHRGTFRNDMPYHGDNQRDPRFEEFCFRAAFFGQRIHDYTETVGLSGWGDIVVSPLERTEEDLGYCQFTIELTPAAEPGRMASVSRRASLGVLRTCLTLRDSGGFRESVQRVLEDIVRETEALAGRVILTDSGRQSISELCACLPEGDSADYAVIRCFRELEGLTRTLIVTNASEMALLERYNASVAQAMHSYGLTSLLLTPLRRGKATLGFLYLLDFRRENVVEIKELVELDCFFLGLKLSNNALVAQLEELSLTDGLTGLGNRNAMLRCLHRLEEAGASFGVVNLDLNGLKAVNDGEGHEAGDRLLVRAARTLTGVFSTEQVFRTGGDEFIILAEGLSEEAFRQRLERLRASQAETGVSFAQGGCWSGGTLSAGETMRRADERMYADKQDYYRRHPEQKRR